MSYKNFSARDVLRLAGVPMGTGEYKTQCPWCYGKNLYINRNNGIVYCQNHCGCGKTVQVLADGKVKSPGEDAVGYYARIRGIDSKTEARKEIEKELGVIPDEKGEIRPRYYTPQETEPVIEETPKAAPEILDDTYRAFLAELELSEKNKGMLIGRGFSEIQTFFLNYKTFPSKAEMNYRNLCRKLLADGHQLEGVPGFFKDSYGWTFTQYTKGILVPVLNHKGQVIGLHLRKDDDLRVYWKDGELEPKCMWFSSKNKSHGTSSNAPIHYACEFKKGPDGEDMPVFEKGFVLTEGQIKADLIHFLQPNLPCIAVGGVDAVKELSVELKRLKEMGVETILLCYDMDYKTNPYVQNALEKTREVIETTGLRLKHMEWETSIVIDGVKQNVLKGLDDYLAYTKLNIVPTAIKKK